MDGRFKVAQVINNFFLFNLYSNIFSLCMGSNNSLIEEIQHIKYLIKNESE
jgi:hypothetical protein